MANRRRVLDRSALVYDGTPRLEAARARARAAKKAFRRMDPALGSLRSALADMAAGRDASLRAGKALDGMEEAMDELWRWLSEADYYLRLHMVNDRPHSLGADETLRTSRVYMDEPAWKPSDELCCPVCGDFLVVGPAEGDLYCPYCGRLVGASERRPFENKGAARLR